MAGARNIRAGELRHFAELQSKTLVSDGAGGSSTTWSKARDLWCNIRSISGVQRMESMRLESSISHEIDARYNADITTDKRIVLGSVAYSIDAVIPDAVKAFVTVIASSGVAT